MTLELSLQEGILHVKSSLPTINGPLVMHWYFDTYNWMVSSTGKEDSIPDTPMAEQCIEAVKERYLAVL